MTFTACKREVRRKLLHKTSNRVLKISTYQLNRSLKVMVTNEHLVFSHRQEGLLIHVDEEYDGILLCASRHKYSEIIGIEVTHVRNRRLHLVEGASAIDDFQSTLWIRGHHARQGMDPLLRQNISAQQQLVKQPFLTSLIICKPRREHRSSDYP